MKFLSFFFLQLYHGSFFVNWLQVKKSNVDCESGTKKSVCKDIAVEIDDSTLSSPVKK